MAIRADDLPFDLRALEIFLAVCEHGAMSGAARILGLTQPAISQTVADLERKTGTTLFDRSVRPIALTPAGVVLRQRAAALVSEARQIGPLLKETQRGRLALVRLGIVDSLSRALSVPLAGFLHQRADTVIVQSGLTAAHAGALLTRNLDLFIGVDDMVEVAGLERFELVSEPYILLLPAGTPPPRSVSEFSALGAKLPFVRYSARSKTGSDIERHLRRINAEFPAGIAFDTPYPVTETVACGNGFAISTPLCLAESGLDDHVVASAPLPGPQLSRTLTLIARRQELGTLPRDLAEASRITLRKETIPPLVRRMPWIADALGRK